MSNSEFPRIRIITDPERPHPQFWRVEINGEDISSAVRGLTLRSYMGEIVTLDLSLIGRVELPEELRVQIGKVDIESIDRGNES